MFYNGKENFRAAYQKLQQLEDINYCTALRCKSFQGLYYTNTQCTNIITV